MDTEKPNPECDPIEQRLPACEHRRLGWPIWKWLLFFALTLPVPALALYASWADRSTKSSINAHWPDVIWMSAGLLAALLWLLAHAAIHWVFLGSTTVAEGLLPFESWFTSC